MAGAIALVIGGSTLIPSAVTTGDVTYRSMWDAVGVDLDPDGTWSTTTDLGYRVVVESASLATYSVTLVSCPHDHGILDAAAALLGPGVALAGHDSADDPALLGIGTVDTISAGDTVVRGTVTIHEPSYCEGHIAWGDTDAGTTMAVIGYYLAPGATELVPFHLETGLAWGLKTELTVVSAPVHLEIGEPAEVTIVTTLAGLFDDIDFAIVDDEDGRQLLRNLAAATRFEVTSGTAH